MNCRPSEGLIALLKILYPAGTRIELDAMSDDPHPIAPGTRGTVRIVDDMGTIHCDFDNGRKLGLIYKEDSFHVAMTNEERLEVVLRNIAENLAEVLAEENENA